MRMSAHACSYARLGLFDPSEPIECWPWLGHIDQSGYGKYGSSMSYRLVYEVLAGPIPAGFHLDHICHTDDTSCAGGPSCLHRRCVNPRHLEVVTETENNLRGRSPHGINSRKDQCIHGHPFDEANTYVRPNGHRDCRTCTTERQRQYQIRKRAHARKELQS